MDSGFNKAIDTLKEKPIILGVIAAIVIAVLIAIFFLPGQQETTLNLNVIDNQGNAVSNADVLLEYQGNSFSLKADSFGFLSVKVPYNSEVKVTASKNAFKTKTETLQANQESIVYDIILEQERARLEKTLLLKSEDGSLLDGEPVTVSFSCSNPGINAPAEIISSNGIVEVESPENCGLLMAQASTELLSTNSSINTELEDELILEEREFDTGLLRIEVYTPEQDPANGISVSLYDSDDSSFIDSGSTVSGAIEFENVIVGDYYVSVSDSQGNYSSQSSNDFTVIKNRTNTVRIDLQREVRAMLKVTVNDANSNQAVSNAAVELSRNNQVVSRQNSNSSGEANFSLYETGSYQITVIHDNYLQKRQTISVSSGSNEQEISLTVLTPENSGRILVNVKDEDDLPVEYAELRLYDAQTDLLYPTNQRPATDSNGEGVFTGIEAGTYYVKALKYPAEAKSLNYTIDPSIENRFDVSLVIGEGSIRIEAKDSTGNLVPFAEATVYTRNGTSLGSFDLDSFGIGEFTTKADKEVYVKVSKDGYSSYITRSYRILPNQRVNVTAIMDVTLSGDKPLVTFLGFQERDENNSINAGSSYLALLQLKIPEGLDLEEAGLHFRTGELALMENDNIFIKSIDAPNSVIVKGTTYNPPNGWNNDQSNITNGDAKWANIMLDNPEEGIYNFGIELGIKPRTVSGENLRIEYRGYGIHAGTTLRDPVDLELGTSLEIPSKNALYANTYSQNYNEGQPQECGLDFCYYGENVYDAVERIYLNDPYSIFVFNDHKLYFNISNNSDIIHNDALLSIKNARINGSLDDVLNIKGYKIWNADLQLFEASNLDVYEIEDIPLGYFSKNKSIRGEILFEPKKTDATNIEIDIISSGRPVFDNAIPFTVIANEQMAAEVSPEDFPAFMELDVDVHVEDSDGLPVRDAEVFLRRVSPYNAVSLIGPVLTNGAGNATVELPASSPNSKVYIEVQKPGYSFERIQKTINPSIIEFDPESISINLEALSNRDVVEWLEYRNITGEDFSIYQTSVVSDFGFLGLIDEQQLINYPDRLIGSQILSQQVVDLESFRAKLLDNVREVREQETINGKLLIYFQNLELGKFFAEEIPFTINIGTGVAGVSNCIVIDTAEWQDIALEGRVSKEFYFRNQCRTEAGPLELDGLQADIYWQGNENGTVQLTIIDLETGQEATHVMQEGNTKLFFDEMKIAAQTEYLGRLTYVPKEGSLGENSNFSIVLDASLPSEQGPVFVGSNRQLEASILNTDLARCIAFEPEPQSQLVLESEADETEFTLNTEECGDVDLKIIFCKEGMDKCRGGTKEGGIELTPWAIDRINQDSYTVKVERGSGEIAGLYGIEVEAKPVEGSYSYRRVATLDAIVEPRLIRDYFYFDHYDISLVGIGSEDAVTLVNTRNQEPVSVTADLCAWGKASGVDYRKTAKSFRGIAAIVSGAKIGAAVGPISAIIGAVVGLVVVAFTFEKDCHDHDATKTLIDYVINLQGTNNPLVPTDARDLFIGDNSLIADYNSKLNIEWDLNGPIDLYVDDESIIEPEGLDAEFENVLDIRETIGIKFKNTGLTDPSSYALVTVNALEHVHGDALHRGVAEVFCGSGFAPFYIPIGTCTITEDKLYTQKFHVRVETQDLRQSIPKQEFDRFACTSGALTGVTGPGAKPRVLLNWNWQDMDKETCAASNPNYAVCDATQFAMSLSERINILDEFLKINNYEFACPTNTSDETEDEINNDSVERTLQDGFFGILELENQFESTANNLVSKAKISNNTDDDRNITVEMSLFNFADNEIAETCTDKVYVNGNDEGIASCGFDNLEFGTYYVHASIPADSPYTSAWDPILPVSIISDAVLDPTECWAPRMTDFVNGESWLAKTVREDPSVNWTDQIKSPEDITELLRFNTYIMRDNYTNDFRQDFVDYYTRLNYSDTPVYFYQDLDGRNLKDYFLDQNRLIFKGKYVDSHELDESGLYEVSIVVSFDEAGNWNLYNSQGRPQAKISVIFYHLRKPYPNSPFYSLPLDGMVGFNGTTIERQDYGVQYSNNKEEINIAGGLSPLTTSSSGGSNALIELTTDRKEDLQYLNSSLDGRGILMHLTTETPVNKKLFFNPSYATPVILKVNHGIDNEPFSAFYALTQNNVPVDSGSSLTFWDGAGNCLDFSGLPVTEAFNFTPDRSAKEEDGLPDWGAVYGLDWQQSFYSGDVYLRGIFYTPRNQNTELAAISPRENLLFVTPDRQGQTVLLTGITGMPYNNPNSSINSIKEVFDLVDQNIVCVTNSGVETKYWWNPKAIYTAEGELERSIHDETIAINEQDKCILPGLNDSNSS